ncbi:MAG: DUF983 domain-containing protein [Rhizobiaceae bacterium]
MGIEIHKDHAGDILEQRSVWKAIKTGVQCKCPNCSKGSMFVKWLKVEPICKNCGEELFHERAEDFPPYLTIVIVGHIILTLVMIVESRFDWSLQTQLSLWIPLTLALALGIMQPVKGGVVGLQWALRMFGFENRANDE